MGFWEWVVLIAIAALCGYAMRGNGSEEARRKDRWGRF